MSLIGTDPTPRTLQPPASMPRDRDRLRAVRQVYCALIVVAAVVQLVFFSRAEDNVATTLLALVSSLIGISYSLNGRRVCAHPVSALILLLFTTTATAGALLVKSVEWSPIADRLNVPVPLFSMLLACQLIVILADQIYLRFQPLQAFSRFLTNRILLPMGLMRWPSDHQLWLLGFIGCVSVMLTGTDYESGATFGMAGAGAKLFRAFGFFKFAPFLIPFRDALSGVPSRKSLPVVPLAFYFLGLVGISFATNSRSTFADAIPTIGLCLLVATALGRFSLKRVPISNIVVFALGAAVAAMLLSRVALAMVVVRDFRYGVDVGMLINLTVEAFFNTEWLEAAKAKMDTSVNVGNYSEDYVDSRFAARFLLTKFHDNMLYYFSLFGDDHFVSYKQFMLARFAATLPDPLLRFFGIDVDKQDLIMSAGDYVVYVIDGWGLGGYKTGSMMSEVFSVYGWAFPFVLTGVILMLFVAYDAFVARLPNGRLAFSPLILLLIWNLCGTTAAFGLGAETVTAIPAGIARGIPQNVLVFVIAVFAVRTFSRLTGRR